MKKPALRFATVLLLVFQATVVLAAGLVDDLAQYRQKTTGALAAERDSKAKIYLQECLTLADTLTGLEAGNPLLSKALADFGQKHTKLDALDFPVTDQVTVEQNAYVTHVQRYTRADFAGRAKLQADLLERKYFNTKTAKNANILEGFINGRWSLTRADDTRIDEKDLGVKPWEAIFRLEPTLVMRGGPQAAVMGTAGLSYTFFPEIDVSTSPPTLKGETFASRWVKKSGVRLGAGAGRIDSKTRFLIGPGVQVNALAIWGIYEPHDRAWMLGFSTADLSSLKKVFGWFD